MSQELGFAETGDDRSWRAEWAERLERIDQHLIELNEALLLLLALDDLTHDTLTDTRTADQSRPAAGPKDERPAAMEETLREIRTALEGPIARLEAVAERLASAAARCDAATRELQALAAEHGERLRHESSTARGEKARPASKSRQVSSGNLVVVRPVRPAREGTRASRAPAAGPPPTTHQLASSGLPTPVSTASLGRPAASTNPGPTTQSSAGAPSGDTGNRQQSPGRRRWLW